MKKWYPVSESAACNRMDISEILQKLGLHDFQPKFVEQKISTDIVCKLSKYDFECLGLRDDRKIVQLRTECLKYVGFQPTLRKQQYEIPKETIEYFLEIGFSCVDISKMFGVSESTMCRRMRMYGLSNMEFSDISEDYLDDIVSSAVNEYPNCGETMLRPILMQQNIKVRIIFIT